jgi:mannose-6-phosphate isomerase-like protein (cupin superfamily)
MTLETKSLNVRGFDTAKLRKHNLFETSRLFCDVYCLEPGQAQRPHLHEGADKIYAALEGAVQVTIGSEQATLTAGSAVLAPSGVEHGLENRGPARAAVLVFMARSPPT